MTKYIKDHFWKINLGKKQDILQHFKNFEKLKFGSFWGNGFGVYLGNSKRDRTNMGSHPLSLTCTITDPLVHVA